MWNIIPVLLKPLWDQCHREQFEGTSLHRTSAQRGPGKRHEEPLPEKAVWVVGTHQWGKISSWWSKQITGYRIKNNCLPFVRRRKEEKIGMESLSTLATHKHVILALSVVVTSDLLRHLMALMPRERLATRLFFLVEIRKWDFLSLCDPNRLPPPPLCGLDFLLPLSGKVSPLDLHFTTAKEVQG